MRRKERFVKRTEQQNGRDGFATVWRCPFLGDLVVPDALGVSSGHGGRQVGRGELTDDGGWFLALLFVDQLVVACEGAHRLDLAAIDGFLLELLAELELDGGVLEGRGGVEGVLVSVLDQFDRWRDAVSELAEHHANTCCSREMITEKRMRDCV